MQRVSIRVILTLLGYFSDIPATFLTHNHYVCKHLPTWRTDNQALVEDCYVQIVYYGFCHQSQVFYLPALLSCFYAIQLRSKFFTDHFHSCISSKRFILVVAMVNPEPVLSWEHWEFTLDETFFK